MGCNCGQHAVTKYRLLAPNGTTHNDYDSLNEARGINDSQFNGHGVIRTVRLPKVPAHR